MKTITTIVLALVALALTSCSNNAHDKSPEIDSAKYYQSKIPMREMDDLGHIFTVDTSSGDSDTLRNVFYKAKCLENGTTMMVVAIQPYALAQTLYAPGDTVWVNVNTQYVDNIDTCTMKYRILSILH